MDGKIFLFLRLQILKEKLVKAKVNGKNLLKETKITPLKNYISSYFDKTFQPKKEVNLDIEPEPNRTKISNFRTRT